MRYFYALVADQAVLPPGDSLESFWEREEFMEVDSFFSKEIDFFPKLSYKMYKLETALWFCCLH